MNETVVHRHTGGLETHHPAVIIVLGVHRHTGGLEKPVPNEHKTLFVHRHTGGLEIVMYTRMM